MLVVIGTRVFAPGGSGAPGPEGLVEAGLVAVSVAAGLGPQPVKSGRIASANTSLYWFIRCLFHSEVFR
jgi:hypothetical protein